MNPAIPKETQNLRIGQGGSTNFLSCTRDSVREHGPSAGQKKRGKADAVQNQVLGFLGYNFNPNARVLPFLNDAKYWPTFAAAERVARLTAPLLELYAPTAVVSRAVIGGARAVYAMTEAHQAWPQQTAKAVVLCAMVVGSTLCPVGALAMTRIGEMCHHLARAAQCAQQGEHKQAALELAGLMHSAIYLGSATLGAPELIVLSLFAQACSELYSAYAEWCKEDAHAQRFGPYPEIAVNLLLATVRIAHAAPKARSLYLDHFGKVLTQRELDNVLDDIEAAKFLRAMKEALKKLDAGKTAPPRVRSPKCGSAPRPFSLPPLPRIAMKSPRLPIPPALPLSSSSPLRLKPPRFTQSAFRVKDSLPSTTIVHKPSLRPLDQRRLEGLMHKVRQLQGIRMTSKEFARVAPLLKSMFLQVLQLAPACHAKITIIINGMKYPLYVDKKFWKEINALRELLKGSKLFSFREEFLEILKSALPIDEAENEDVDFSELLYAQGYSSRLNGLDFSKRILEEVHFNNMRFSQCDFTAANCRWTKFSGTEFTNCNLKRMDAFHSTWENSTVKESSIRESQWVGSTLKNMLFDNLNARGAYFSDAEVLGVTFKKCTFSEAVFLGVRPYPLWHRLLPYYASREPVPLSSMIDCDLTDALLCDAPETFSIVGGTPNRITRPVIAQGWDFFDPLPFGQRIDKHVRRSADVIRLHYSIDTDYFLGCELDDAVEDSLQQIRAHAENVPVSIPRAILESAPAGSPIQRVEQVAQTILQYADGIVLPGGDDVEPFYYGGKGEGDEWDYYRTLLEFSLLAEAEKQNVPVLGICRGLQVGAVFYGGKLQQSLSGHIGRIQQLVRSDADPAGTAFLERLFPHSEPIRGLSMHRQGVLKKDLGPGLISLLEKDGVVKSAMTPDERALFFQFHPEVFERHAVLHNNARFFEPFLLKVMEHKRAKDGV